MVEKEVMIFISYFTFDTVYITQCKVYWAMESIRPGTNT